MPDSKPQPHPDLKKLDALVGTWNSEGETVATPDVPSITVRGMDRYEWLPGGFFLIHWVDVYMGDEKVYSIEMIGPYDSESQSIPMRSFDHQGNVGMMQASVDDEGVWTFAGERMRACLTLSNDKSSMTAHWEQTQDGQNWTPWMEMRFTKMA
jgi:hypothetical protein